MAWRNSGDRRAALVNRLLCSRERLIGATLLGNTLVNIGASAFTTSVLVALAGDRGAIYATGAHDRRSTRLRRGHAENRGDQLSRPHLAAGRPGDLLLRHHFRADSHRVVEVFVRGALETLRPSIRAAGIRFCSGPRRIEKRRRSPASRGRRRPVRPRHVRRPARLQRPRSLRRHGPSHQNARHQRRFAAARIVPRGGGRALFAPAALARRAGKYRRRAACQGSFAGPRAAGGDRRQFQGREHRARSLVRARHDSGRRINSRPS